LRNGLKDTNGKSTIIFGDSHNAYAIKNKYLSKNIYNWSYPGESIISTEIKLQKLLVENSHLETVILSISPNNIASRRGGETSYLHYYPIFSFKEINTTEYVNFFQNIKILISYLCPYLLDDKRRLVQEVFINHYLLGQDLNNRKSFCYDKYNDLVHGETLWHTTNIKKRKTLSLNRYKTLKSIYFDDSLLKGYERAIQLCQLNNIKVIGVLMPLSNEILSLIDKDLEWQEWQLKMNNLSFDAVISFQDEFINNQDYFLNSDHLNMKGSRIFTEIFINELNSNVY